MPEKGTSLINDTFRPVKNPLKPSFRKIFLLASVIELYSLKPITSSLVLIIMMGLLTMLYTALAIELETKWT